MNKGYFPNDIVTVPKYEIKTKVELSIKNTVLIVVDMQNDFVKPKGKLLVPGAEKTIDNIKTITRKFRDESGKIIYTQDTHVEGDKEWELWPEHCRENTWGWEIIEELKPENNDLVVTKNRYDGFYGTDMEHFLSHVWNVDSLVITGTVANICVAHTAASAGLRWYDIVVPADCISAMTDFDQALTLRQISTLYAGEVVKSANDINLHH